MGRKTNSQREPGNQKEPYVPSNLVPELVLIQDEFHY